MVKDGKRREIPPDRVGVTELAAATRNSYHTARNYMLRGDYGPSRYDRGALTVARKDLERWLRLHPHPSGG